MSSELDLRRQVEALREEIRVHEARLGRIHSKQEPQDQSAVDRGLPEDGEFEIWLVFDDYLGNRFELSHSLDHPGELIFDTRSECPGTYATLADQRRIVAAIQANLKEFGG